VKKAKSYDEYKKEAAARNQAIFEKYGAPPEARPPMDKDVIPASSDRHYRKYAFTYKRRLENWPKSGRSYK